MRCNANLICPQTHSGKPSQYPTHRIPRVSSRGVWCFERTVKPCNEHGIELPCPGVSHEPAVSQNLEHQSLNTFSQLIKIRHVLINALRHSPPCGFSLRMAHSVGAGEWAFSALAHKTY